jgi:hypothetical protein
MGRYRSGLRRWTYSASGGAQPRLNHTADLDGKIDAAPGLRIPGAAHHALTELVTRGYARVIVTANLDPLIVTAWPGAGTEKSSSAQALPRSKAPTKSRGWLVSLGT